MKMKEKGSCDCFNVVLSQFYFIFGYNSSYFFLIHSFSKLKVK